MSDRDTVKNLMIAAGVFMLVLAIAPGLLPTPPQPVATDSSGETVSGGSTTPPDSGAAEPDGDTGSSGTSTPPPATSNATGGGFRVVGAEAEQTFSLGAPDDIRVGGVEGEEAAPNPFRAHLTVTNRGAGVSAITLSDYRETIDSEKPYHLVGFESESGEIAADAFTVDAVSVEGQRVELSDVPWSARERRDFTDDQSGLSGHELTLWVDVYRGDAPVIRVVRIYRIPEFDVESPRRDIFVRTYVENTGDAKAEVFLTLRAGASVPIAATRTDDRFLDIGVVRGNSVEGRRRPKSEVEKAPGSVLELYTPDGSDPTRRLSWVASGNTYFTCTLAPKAENGSDNPTYVSSVIGVDLDKNATVYTTEDVAIQYLTSKTKLDPGERQAYPAEVYIGAKRGDAFKEYPAYAARNYYFQIEQGFGWCTFTWLVELMIWLLNHLEVITFDYGLAIIVLVLIVRTLLHPITKKGQVNMVRMQQKMGEFTPKFEELKKKYGNDKVRLQQEQMKLYRELDMNPATQMLTCLPMMLQMPIWIALFLSLSNNVLMRHEGVHFTWIDDLTAPDALITFGSPLPLIGASFNLLPLFVSLFMYLQTKLQPKPKPNPNATDQQRAQQEMMQKMMPLMSIMMLFFFYKAPSGLNLYIMFSSLFGTIEQHRIRKHIRDREEAGTLVPEKKPKGPAEGGKPSFLQKMQQMAEEAQKQQLQKDPGKKGGSRHKRKR